MAAYTRRSLGAVRNILRTCHISNSWSRSAAIPASRSLSQQPGITRRSSHVSVSEEVRAAVAENRPVVALESTIITHGMPYPDNLRTAQDVEGVVRGQGAVPATVAVLAGRLCVGLSPGQLEELADSGLSPVKVSSRDLPLAVSEGWYGGTTVAATMRAAHMAGISVFVTGGVGGVHRRAALSFDVSADLTELSRTPVAVVCAGVKSILDIPATLEVLETLGVTVVSYGDSTDFPAFYTRESGHQAPYAVHTASQAARVIHAGRTLGQDSATLIAVPIPPDHAIDTALVEGAIEHALQEAGSRGVTGKAVTPYLLQQVSEMTAGQSLTANIALIKNNALVGSQIACSLADITEPGGDTTNRSMDRTSPHASKPSRSTPGSQKAAASQQAGTSAPESSQQASEGDPPRVVVVGGINIDFTSTFSADNVSANGGTYPGTVRTSCGGVGRNTADALTRLGVQPLLISAVGQDTHAESFYHQCRHMDVSGVREVEEASTATYSAVLQRSGDLIYGIGDFHIHAHITPGYVEMYQHELMSAPLVMMDGNIPACTMAYISSLCRTAQVPVWFDPADVGHVRRVFEADMWQHLSFISPNLNELRAFSALAAGGGTSDVTQGSRPSGTEREVLAEAAELVRPLLPHISTVFVTLGQYGVLVARNTADPDTPFLQSAASACDAVSLTHYPIPPRASACDHIVSVSGAGDCLNAGVIWRMLGGHDPDTCMKTGLLAARLSLPHHHAIPHTLTPQALAADTLTREFQDYTPTDYTQHGGDTALQQ